MMIDERIRPWLLAVACGLLGACKADAPVNGPDARVPLASAPEWRNWSGDLVHRPHGDGSDYYFSPTTRAELQKILAERPAGTKVRVSGQRHSQAPLVLEDNRGGPPEAATTWIVDLSCYADLGPDGRDVFVLDAPRGKLTVNAGVREDQVDAFLTEHDLMLQTVTAGGFFSIGGMTAIDVHGGTVKAPIFAETASAFTIMGADGSVTTIDERSPLVHGASPLQLARVSLGALGIVTSVTLDVQPRPYATTVVGGHGKFKLATEDEFVARYRALVADHDRLESFYNPYSHEFLVLWWDVEASPARKRRNAARAVANACTLAGQGVFGAPLEAHVVEGLAERSEQDIQLHGTNEEAKLMIGVAMDVIEDQVLAAGEHHSDLWLRKAIQGMFMSYFLELPALDEAGLRRVWQGLQVVAKADSSAFRLAAPLEFRFIRGGNSLLAGTYTTTPGAVFVNFDLIGFVDPVPVTEYSPAMLAFFAGIERAWVERGGWPHNGKMYGFYDPTAPAGTATTPFDPAYLRELTERRRDRVEVFAAHRRTRDPEGVFCNAYLEALSLCETAAPSEPAAPAVAAPGDRAPRGRSSSR
jgi:FAD/FMN-containing dehydrogenase